MLHKWCLCSVWHRLHNTSPNWQATPSGIQHEHLDSVVYCLPRRALSRGWASGPLTHNHLALKHIGQICTNRGTPAPPQGDYHVTPAGMQGV